MGGAHVTRVGFPTSVEEWDANLDDNGVSDLELLLTSGSVIWSAPAWALVGDIVLFQMTLRAAAAWRKLNRALFDPAQLIDDGAGEAVFPDWFVRLRAAFFALNRVTKREVGGEVPGFSGCIFAAAVVAEPPEYGYTDQASHHASRVFAHLASITPLRHPIQVVKPSPLSEYGAFAGPGPLVHRSFNDADALSATIEAIESRNRIPPFMQAVNLQERSPITASNWMEHARVSEGRYPTEAHLRRSLGNYLLAAIADRGKVESEVEVLKMGRRTGFADYLIAIDGYWVPVEVKLNHRAADRVLAQIARYSGPATFIRGGKRIGSNEHPFGLLMDREGIYLLQGGTYVDCDVERPLLTRADLTEDAITNVRHRIADTLRAATA